MQYVIENDCDLSNFEPWGGAVVRLKGLLEHDTAYQFVSDLLEEWCETENVSDTQINDYIWFQMDEDLAEMGYLDPETYEYTEAAN